jgi:hypothetical protein
MVEKETLANFLKSNYKKGEIVMGEDFQRERYLLGNSEGKFNFHGALSRNILKPLKTMKNTTEKLKSKKKINGYSIHSYEFSF